MAATGVPRILLHLGAVLGVVVLITAGWMAGLIGDDAPCHYCGGKGAIYCSAEQKLDPCLACEPVRKERLHRFESTLVSILDAIVPAVWVLLLVLSVVIVIRGRRAGCRLCGGSGRLALDVLPPGEAGFSVDVDCVACEGRRRRRE